MAREESKVSLWIRVWYAKGVRGGGMSQVDHFHVA